MNFKDFLKNKKVALILCIILVIVIIASIFLIFASNKNENNNLDVNNEQNVNNNEDESDFSGPEYKTSKVYDENNEEISLSDFSNTAMALVFFDLTDESLDVIKIFEKYEKDYLDKVNIVGVCVEEESSNDINAVKEKIKESNINLKNVLYDLDYSAQNEYSVFSAPTLVFINKQNQIINTLTTSMNEDVITANLDILAENY